MKIEILFPEICNLYGDLANIRYLKECMPDLEIIETNLPDEPLFASEVPDMIYMGTTTENGQIMAIEKLSAYKERISQLIEEGANFLITGNALEIFGGRITEDGKDVAEGLGIIPTHAERSGNHRFNSLYLGKFDGDGEEIKVVGYKSQFGHSYADGEFAGLFDTQRGPGLNPEIKPEGIRINNFYATYIIGPLFILNPVFAGWYMKNRLGADDVSLAYEDAIMDAYNTRLAEYSDESTGFYYDA